MNIEWFSQRLFELRNKKNVSARDMSLSLGQSESYINKIENQKALPSMSMFFYMCEYLDITPGDFFNENLFKDKKTEDVTNILKDLSDSQLDALITLINAFVKNKKIKKIKESFCERLLCCFYNILHSFYLCCDTEDFSCINSGYFSVFVYVAYCKQQAFC